MSGQAWTSQYHGEQQHYAPTFEHHVELTVMHLRARVKRLLELAARPNCTPKRKAKLERKAREVMRRVGASGR